MAKRLLTECPYCHRKVSYFGANILKTKGEHSCKGCKCISNIVIHRALYGIASAAVVFSLLILVLYSAFGNHGNLWGVFFVLLPFLIFYLIVPFFVRLEPCSDRSAVNKLRRKVDPIPTAKEKPSKKQEQPIELNVGDDFTTSFMKAKNRIKPAKLEYDENDSRIIKEEGNGNDIDSGIDYDISASMNPLSEINEPAKEQQAAIDEGENIKIYQKSADTYSEEETKAVVFDTNTENSVSFISGSSVTETDDQPIETPAEKGEDVSFIFGIKKD